ncbi:unnamed protein product, partial [marine sediment metagenome]
MMDQNKQQAMPDDMMDQIEKVEIEERSSASTYTRLAATVVLVVAGPMLLLSSSALVL